jgi:hypothetical protein
VAFGTAFSGKTEESYEYVAAIEPARLHACGVPTYRACGFFVSRRGSCELDRDRPMTIIWTYGSLRTDALHDPAGRSRYDFMLASIGTYMQSRTQACVCCMCNVYVPILSSGRVRTVSISRNSCTGEPLTCIYACVEGMEDWNFGRTKHFWKSTSIHEMGQFGYEYLSRS